MMVIRRPKVALVNQQWAVLSWEAQDGVSDRNRDRVSSLRRIVSVASRYLAVRTIVDRGLHGVLPAYRPHDLVPAG